MTRRRGDLPLEARRAELQGGVEVNATAEQTYKQYLNSSAWRRRRDAAVRRAGGRCQVCGSRKHLNVHHRDYTRVASERDEDLTVLCRKCHTHFHGVINPNLIVSIRAPKSVGK